MKKRTASLLLIIASLFLFGVATTRACTTAVISGKRTVTGRPLIWKVRDTEAFGNHIRRFRSPIGEYVGLINNDDTEGEAVWGGHNSHGFAIMNSASFNVNNNDTTSYRDQEGVVMKKALAGCRTLTDFEKLLDGLPKPMGLAAHFGVIDAEGGAAFYEVNNYTWTKFDANESPDGYIIRTNYSMTGKKDEGYGYLRYRSAEYAFSGVKGNGFSPLLVGSDFSRLMYHSLLGVDYRDLSGRQGERTKSGYINSDDLLSRYDTSSMILVEGVKVGEDPLLTTSWVEIGNPYLTPLVPVWTWEEVPEALSLPTENNQEKSLSELSLTLKGQLYPLSTVEKSRYLYFPLLFRKDKSGLTDQLMQLEAEYIPLIEDATDQNTRSRLRDRMISSALSIMREKIKEPSSYTLRS